MRAVDLIAKKRDGAALSRDEIRWLIASYANGTIPDYQMSAWAMAVVWRGMDDRETADLTMAMAESGDMLDLHDLVPLTVDKHSTGGVGDKTTLLLAPMIAAVGLPMAKMSGRGLGFSGGTVDKLESIPGLRTNLSAEEFRHALSTVGLVIAAQSGDLAPADKKLYALRDVTATVESIPLIAASVMSKKLAAGADCIILDVKYGSGAFMHTPEAARTLAQTMVAIGKHAGRRVAATISSMQQPLGFAIGNALEVREAIAALRGHGPDDLVELCLTLGTQLVRLTGLRDNDAAARSLLQEALTSGAAWQRFVQMIAHQGGDLRFIEEPELLPTAPVQLNLMAPQSGYVAAIDGQALGTVCNQLGGGRQRKDDRIDSRVGLVLYAKVGDAVNNDMPLVTIHAASIPDAERVIPQLRAAYQIASSPVAVPPLIEEIVR
ncbi:pyrimidine-nucleoside phosphorylase [Oscillochloris trichoides DG-6]|uniref:Pyrimidine-nucleoside phosphorylase n=1 Tax=Oscillochloris trichoides DG-6 TaxID=765420 RepID=E1IG85_9CHLR|nr:thymidine phosphorylase [Oscillochloris trichoides]EFO79819.1 pyrimidine-nucleoside phosphorylase [Oscillochloris trichoides DG-6]